MYLHVGIEISEDLKSQIFANCGKHKVSDVTQQLLNDFGNGKVNIPFAPIPPANQCSARLDMTLDFETLEKARKMNETSLQRTNRWLITRLWQMRLNGEI